MKRAALTLKIFLSVWIVYNLVAIILMPNAGSFLGRRYVKYVAPYANVVGLNSSWNFFSPDPVQTFYIKYFVEFFDSEGDTIKDPIVGFFPQEGNQGVMDINRRRELYVMRFMVIAPNRLQALFAPWLCRQYPEATAVHIEQVIETVAALDEALTMSHSSLKDLSKEIPYASFDFRCDTPAEDFPL